MHYIQVLCKSRLCKADHDYFTYLTLQRQISHVNGRELVRHQVEASSTVYFWSRLLLCYEKVHSHDFQSQSYNTTDGQSVSPSWYQVPIWDPRPIFPLLSLIIFRQLLVCRCKAPSLTRSRVCSFSFCRASPE
jgi:hypothetical protein